MWKSIQTIPKKIRQHKEGARRLPLYGVLFNGGPWQLYGNAHKAHYLATTVCRH
jgi:hypothetical protein